MLSLVRYNVAKIVAARFRCRLVNGQVIRENETGRDCVTAAPPDDHVEKKNTSEANYGSEKMGKLPYWSQYALHDE
jgi:hypothetical protein